MIVGLWMRMTLHESHVYREAEAKGKTQNAPVKEVITKHWKPILQGTFIMTATYVLFYVMTAFVQVYSKTKVGVSEWGHPTGLGIPANTFTGFLLIAAVVFGISISLSASMPTKSAAAVICCWLQLPFWCLACACRCF